MRVYDADAVDAHLRMSTLPEWLINGLRQFEVVPPSPRVRKTDPETSHLAAAAVDDEDLSEIKRSVLVVFEDITQGLTDDELRLGLAQEVPGMKFEKTSITKRRGELEKSGYLRKQRDEQGFVKRPALKGGGLMHVYERTTKEWK